MNRVCIFGVGYVGLPLSVLLARSFDVLGFDIDANKTAKLMSGQLPIREPDLEDLLKTALASGRLTFTSRTEATADSKVKIITVGTPYSPDRRTVDYHQLDSALDIVSSNLRQGDVIILKSTVPPGTTGGRVRQAVEAHGWRVPNDIGLAFSPERIVEGQAVQDFATLPKIIGATDDRTFEIAREVIGSLGGQVRRVSKLESAEMVKMIDNYSRYIFLGLTNELALVCEMVGVDAFELIEAAKFDYPRNAGILRPGPGVGGSCLNKDPFVLASLMAQSGLSLEMLVSATKVNRSIPAHVAQLVVRFAGSRSSVVLAGVAFREDTDDTRFSSTLEIAERLRQTGYSVRISDPYAVLPGLEVERDLLAAAQGAQIIVLLTGHAAYRELDFSKLKWVMASNPLILDTRGSLVREKVEELGFEYHGYGRL